MTNTILPHSARNVFVKRPNTHSFHQQQRDVRQDKGTTISARIASTQPAPHAQPLRSHLSNSNHVRTQRKPTPKRKTVHLTTWVKPGVKAELQRIAEQEGISVSAASGAILERGLQQHIDMQYSAFLQPIIEKSIRKEMRAISTRLAWLLVRVAFDAGHIRSLVTNILGRQPGVSQDLLKTILEQSGSSAKKNITRRTPQMAELIAAVENWMLTDENEPEPYA